MIFIGLTGGIGMGKSAVAERLAQRGLPVSDSDGIARALVEPGQPALAEIVSRFGAGMVGPDGRLLRERLARCVFSEEGSRKELEAILHPRIRQAWLSLADQWTRQGCRMGVATVPLLYEISLAGEFDRVMCVACSVPTQRVRLAARGWSEDHIRARERAQWPVDKKIALADFVIWSEGGFDVLDAQLDKILAGISPRR